MSKLKGLSIRLKFFFAMSKYRGKLVFKKGRLIMGLNSKLIIRSGGIISGNGTVTMQNNTKVFAVEGGVIEFKGEAFLNYNAIIGSRNHISIGANCLIGPNVCIYDHNHLFDLSGVNWTDFKTKEIIIGDNCWIGANTVILKGVHIGEGTIIGAGCVVKKDIPAHSIVTNESISIRPIT